MLRMKSVCAALWKVFGMYYALVVNGACSLTHYGHWRQIHRPYKSWPDRGIWSELMSFVSDVDPQAVMIDATIVRAHACASGYVKDGNEAQALGRSKGYDSQELIDTLHNQDCSSVIPSRKNAVCPREIDRRTL